MHHDGILRLCARAAPELRCGALPRRTVAHTLRRQIRGAKEAAFNADPTSGRFTVDGKPIPFSKEVKPVFRQRGFNTLDTLTFYAKAGQGGDGSIYWYQYWNHEF
eukprot:Hpha_TRINITY_DN25434_c0_g1::TRINITY_DN25434_c0_g1_i1::g.167709::m.167709